MAPLWLFFLIIAAAVARLPIQDGFPVNIWEAPQRRWEWTASDDGSPQEDSFLLRRRRESGLRNASKAVEGPPKKGLKMSTLKKPTQELTTVTQSPRSSVAKEAKLPKDGTYRVSKTSSERPPNTEGVLTTTEHWSWLHDDLSSAPAEMLGTESFTKSGTLGPVLKTKGRLTTTIDGLWEDQSTDPGIRNPARPRSRNRPSPYHRTTVPLKLLMDDDETPAVTRRPRLRPGRTGFGDKGKQSITTSTITRRPSLGPGQTGFGDKGKQYITTSAVTRRPSPRPGRTGFGATTAPIPASNASVVSKCLLAISLLALVAGVFIVTAAVLAGLLWRQRQAYRLNRHNQTEMVCISSLLAAEEAEEGWAKRPRVERVRMLRENGTEAESDNLTLNSFLPDH